MHKSALIKARDRALGYHPDIPKRNTNGRRLVAGETKFPQNPVLTEEEENVVKMLKLEELRKILDGMIQTSNDMPAKSTAMA
jgi:hypothetical protein